MFKLFDRKLQQKMKLTGFTRFYVVHEERMHS